MWPPARPTSTLLLVTSSGIRRAPPTLLYAIAIFLSSALLFLIEPLAGKRLLPLLGGSAAVWTACLVFFQCALLLGYLVAHWLVTRGSPRLQAGTYVVLLVLSFGQLLTAINPTLNASASRPITSVLWLLTLLIAVPFVTLSITSPLLQSWYARATHRGKSKTAPQPYRLFAISNVGSLLALVVYPWVIEPRWSLNEQTMALLAGVAVLVAVCATIAYGARDLPPLPAPVADTSAPEAEVRVRDRVLWIALAACASLLLSAMTTHISQNVATIPLLWIIPLVAYLLSFVVAFADERWNQSWLVLALAAGALGATAQLLFRGVLATPIVRATIVYCVSLFLLCWFCHSELYRRRPSPRGLTGFYFCLAAGGALGAILVGIVAPSVLPGNYELPFGLFAVATLALVVTWTAGWAARGFWFVAAGVMLALLVTQVRRDHANVLIRERNFYGTLHVTHVHDSAAAADVRTLLHGVITHGRQIFREDLHDAPTTYYGRTTGVGLALEHCCNGGPRRIGVIGLGTGTLAVYGKPGDVIRFYDINPAVEPIARSYFTYLRQSAAKVEIVNGDARVSLATEPPQGYDVLAIDAFSGDAIPVHLITAEALEVYRRHLKPNGVVAFHISNRYLNLAPVVAQLARNAGLGFAFISSEDDLEHDAWHSDWVLVTADTALLSRPPIARERADVEIPPGLRLWTDDYNSLLPILRGLKR